MWVSPTAKLRTLGADEPHRKLDAIPTQYAIFLRLRPPDGVFLGRDGVQEGAGNMITGFIFVLLSVPSTDEIDSLTYGDLLVFWGMECLFTMPSSTPSVERLGCFVPLHPSSPLRLLAERTMVCMGQQEALPGVNLLCVCPSYGGGGVITHNHARHPLPTPHIARNVCGWRLWIACVFGIACQ